MQQDIILCCTVTVMFAWAALVRAAGSMLTCLVWPHMAVALQQSAEANTSTLLSACVKRNAKSSPATARETVAYSYHSINQSTFPVLGLFTVVNRQ